LDFGRVIVHGTQNPAIIEGAFAESIPAEGLTRITGKPILSLIDSTIASDTTKMSVQSKKGGAKTSVVSRDSIIIMQKRVYDTMTIIADTLETMPSEGNSYVARNNVETNRTSMAASCALARFNPENDTLKLEGRPMIWVD